jgi:hypothetical protein
VRDVRAHCKTRTHDEHAVSTPGIASTLSAVTATQRVWDNALHF